MADRYYCRIHLAFRLLTTPFARTWQFFTVASLHHGNPSSSQLYTATLQNDRHLTS